MLHILAYLSQNLGEKVFGLEQLGRAKHTKGPKARTVKRKLQETQLLPSKICMLNLSAVNYLYPHDKKPSFHQSQITTRNSIKKTHLLAN